MLRKSDTFRLYEHLHFRIYPIRQLKIKTNLIKQRSKLNNGTQKYQSILFLFTVQKILRNLIEGQGPVVQNFVNLTLPLSPQICLLNIDFKSRMRWYGHVERSKGWIAQVRKLNIVAQKRSGKPRKSWDEVLLDNRKKLGMDTADPQNRSEWRGRQRRRLVKQVQPSVEDNGL